MIISCISSQRLFLDLEFYNIPINYLKIGAQAIRGLGYLTGLQCF